MDFWNLMRRKIRESGMTQGGFAEEILGMPESSFSRLMSGGRPSYETLVLISDALGLELLSEPAETDKREKKTCTQAELRDCLERMRDLDTTDISALSLGFFC
jgi:transcriptional regulator with XRE-family HTH domain